MVQRLVLALIMAYRRSVSPWLRTRCRFYPSCSEYAHQAVLKHGVRRGGWMAVKRLLRCGPWSKGGVDSVK